MTAISMAIKASGIACKLSADNKEILFDRLGQLAETGHGLPANLVSDALKRREAEASTGCGAGIAIPHARIVGLEENILLFCSLDPAVDYDAPDGQEVDLVFALLSSADDSKAHLLHLAEIARNARNADHIIRLRGATNADALYALLTQTVLSEAA